MLEILEVYMGVTVIVFMMTISSEYDPFPVGSAIVSVPITWFVLHVMGEHSPVLSLLRFVGIPLMIIVGIIALGALASGIGIVVWMALKALLLLTARAVRRWWYITLNHW